MRIDEPVAGFYRWRYRSGAPDVGVLIWHGPPHEPWTGEEMDRAPRWQATVNGRYIEFERVWPGCSGDPIDEGDYLFLLSAEAWAVENDPNDPFASVREPVDWLNSTPAI